MIGLDYSSARLPGSAIRAAGYDFVVRYVGTPGRAKNIITAEYQDLMAAGVAVALVYENVAEDALGGFAAGQASARAARADADSIGFPAARPIYFAVDWVTGAPQIPIVMDYLDGAANVLGVERVGAYGFQLTIQTAMAGGHARWFWQCGARSALVPGTHLYQHNNDNTTVSGITCDVNDAIVIDFGQCPNPLEDDMTPEQDALLRDVREQLCGAGARIPGTYPGWLTEDGTNRSLTAVDMARETHRETNQRITSRVPGSDVSDTAAGYAANSDAYSWAIRQQIAGLSAAVDKLAAAVAAVHGISADELRQAVADAIKTNVVAVDVNVHGTPTGGTPR